MKRTITRNISLSLAICISVLATDVAFAQGKGNAKKEEQQANEEQKGKSEEARERRRKPTRIKDIAEAKREEVRAKGNDKNKDNSNADKENNGNAYGKNKGELSGRKFGQARAAQAQLISEEKKKEFGKTVYEGDIKAKDARVKIARAREVLEKDKKDKKISDAAYNEKKARIDRAEKAVQVLEAKVQDAKQLEITIE